MIGTIVINEQQGIKVFEYKGQACKEGDCTWSINYFDKVMWWPFTGVPVIIQEIARGLGIYRYPDASWSARYLHHQLSNRLDAQFYRGRYNAPGGIVYLNYAAVSNTYGPFRTPFPLGVYGRNAVAYTPKNFAENISKFVIPVASKDIVATISILSEGDGAR